MYAVYSPLVPNKVFTHLDGSLLLQEPLLDHGVRLTVGQVSTRLVNKRRRQYHTGKRKV